MQGQESRELKQEEEATQCVDFTDESLHKIYSNDSNMDDDDDYYYYFCLRRLFLRKTRSEM
jgi:hypothetical protein